MSKVKDLLYQVRNEQREINIIREQIQQAELAVLPRAIRYDTDRVQSSPDDPMLRMALKLERYEAELARHLDRITARRQKAFKLVASLADPRQRQVLELFFLDKRRLSMEQVAMTMGYSVPQTFRLYRAAIAELSKR